MFYFAHKCKTLAIIRFLQLSENSVEKSGKILCRLGGEFTQKVLKLISGKVIDSIDGKPIALANIYADIS